MSISQNLKLQLLNCLRDDDYEKFKSVVMSEVRTKLEDALFTGTSKGTTLIYRFWKPNYLKYLQFLLSKNLFDKKRKIRLFSNQLTNDQLLLHQCVLYHQVDTPDLLELLLSHGYDSLLKNEKNQESLIIAVTFRNIQQVKLLLKYGARPSKKTQQIKGPLFFAIDNEDTEMIQFLLSSGFNPCDKYSFCGKILNPFQYAFAKTKFALLHLFHPALNELNEDEKLTDLLVALPAEGLHKEFIDFYDTLNNIPNRTRMYILTGIVAISKDESHANMICLQRCWSTALELYTKHPKKFGKINFNFPLIDDFQIRDDSAISSDNEIFQIKVNIYQQALLFLDAYVVPSCTIYGPFYEKIEEKLARLDPISFLETFVYRITFLHEAHHYAQLLNRYYGAFQFSRVLLSRWMTNGSKYHDKLNNEHDSSSESTLAESDEFQRIIKCISRVLKCISRFLPSTILHMKKRFSEKEIEECKSQLFVPLLEGMSVIIECILYMRHNQLDFHFPTEYKSIWNEMIYLIFLFDINGVSPIHLYLEQLEKTSKRVFEYTEPFTVMNILFELKCNPYVINQRNQTIFHHFCFSMPREWLIRHMSKVVSLCVKHKSNISLNGPLENIPSWWKPVSFLHHNKNV